MAFMMGHYFAPGRAPAKGARRSRRRAQSRCLGPWLILLLMLPGLSTAVTFEDQQIRVIDHDDYINDNISVWNLSAFYFQSGGVTWSLTMSLRGWLELSGGLIRQNLILYNWTEANITGGSITYSVHAYNAPTHWSGGTIGGTIYAYSDAVFNVYGSGFAVDGIPVDTGPLSATQGTLTALLNSGESITVDFQQGQVSPYSGSIVLVTGTPTPTPPPDHSNEIVLYDDGAPHLIDHADFLNLPFGIRVRSPGSPTTLEIADGAEIGYGLGFSGPSVVNMTGGQVATLHSTGSSALNAEGGTFNMTGGTFAGWAIMRSGQMNIAGGSITGEVQIEYGANLDFSAGTLGSDLDCHTADPPTVAPSLDITGGQIDGRLRVRDDCVAALRGGSILGELDISGGELEIFGSGFAIDGVPVGFGSVSQSAGTLTGTLESGDPIDNDFSIWQPGVQSELVLSVPEPSAVSSIVAGWLAVLVLGVARRGRGRAGLGGS